MLWNIGIKIVIIRSQFVLDPATDFGRECSRFSHRLSYFVPPLSSNVFINPFLQNKNFILEKRVDDLTVLLSDMTLLFSELQPSPRQGSAGDCSSPCALISNLAHPTGTQTLPHYILLSEMAFGFTVPHVHLFSNCNQGMDLRHAGHITPVVVAPERCWYLPITQDHCSWVILLPAALSGRNG